MASPSPYPLPLSRGSGAIVESSLLHPLLLTQGEREQLNAHVQHKRLQLLWGLPCVTLNSLAAALPPLPAFLECTALRGAPERQRPLFRAERRRLLERHLREKMVHLKWGLPKRIQKSLTWSVAPEAARQEQVPVSAAPHAGVRGRSESWARRARLAACRSEGSGQAPGRLDSVSGTVPAESRRRRPRTRAQSETGEESLLREWPAQLPRPGEEDKRWALQGGEENGNLSEDSKGSWEPVLLGTGSPGTQPALLHGARRAAGTSCMFRNSKGQCHQKLQLGTELEMNWGIPYITQESSPAARPAPAQLLAWEKPSSGAETSPISKISGSQKSPSGCQRAVNRAEPLQSRPRSRASRDEVPVGLGVQEAQKGLVTGQRSGSEAAGPSGGEQRGAQPQVTLTEFPPESQRQPSPAGAPLAETPRPPNRHTLGNQSPCKALAGLSVPGAGREEGLIPDDIRRYFEFHLREKLLHQKWGFPKRLQESMTLFLLLEATIH
ncbi:zinc finger protein 512 isoform X1 [Pelodiscus sinensis]|uniref:zinc finger protein 512 isoform X1 n=1 Tax=Pelodiscus sinensis TaxID=13735 RepID=UPI003F6AEE4C